MTFDEMDYFLLRTQIGKARAFFRTEDDRSCVEVSWPVTRRPRYCPPAIIAGCNGIWLLTGAYVKTLHQRFLGVIPRTRYQLTANYRRFFPTAVELDINRLAGDVAALADLANRIDRRASRISERVDRHRQEHSDAIRDLEARCGEEAKADRGRHAKMLARLQEFDESHRQITIAIGLAGRVGLLESRSNHLKAEQVKLLAALQELDSARSALAAEFDETRHTHHDDRRD